MEKSAKNKLSKFIKSYYELEESEVEEFETNLPTIKANRQYIKRRREEDHTDSLLSEINKEILKRFKPKEYEELPDDCKFTWKKKTNLC